MGWPPDILPNLPSTSDDTKEWRDSPSTVLYREPMRCFINGVPMEQWALDQRLERIEKLLKRLVEMASD